MSNSELIKSLTGKIDLLISDNQRLKKENEKLTGHKDRTQAENRELKETVKNLEHRIRILELRDGVSATGDKQARARINRLMREVDKCIALMNK